VAVELEARGHVRDVRLTARSPDKLLELAARGFAVARADYGDRASMDTAFAGAAALLLISGVTQSELRIKEHRNAIDAAKAAGVGRIVYTSFTNPTGASLFPFAAIHGDTEKYLQGCGVPYTILRNCQYAANLDGSLAESKLSGLLASPAADAKVAYVTHADAAAAAVGALLGEGHAGKTYEITGPEALDLHEIAAVLAEARGTPVHVVRSALADLKAYYQSRHLPPFHVEALVGASAAAVAGEYRRVSPDAERLAGRPTQSIREYARRFA
jgi:NAD(P)H dehydrogenase (quinone)